MPEATHPWTLRALGTVRRGRAARRLGVGGLLVGLPLLLMGSVPGAVAFAGLFAAAAGSAELGRMGRARDGALTVDGEAIRWAPDEGGAWERARADVVSGWHEPDAQGAGQRMVVSFVGGDELALLVPDADAARACLEACGVGVGQRALVFETRSTWFRMAWFFGAFAMGFAALMLAVLTLFSFMVFPWAGVLLLLPLAVSALVTVVMLRPVDAMEVLVGADGLTVRGEVEDRFVPYADVESVRDERGAVVLALRDGREVVVDGPALRAWKRRALAGRIRDALEALHATEATARTRDVLTRGDTPFEAWRDGLHAHARAAAVYRQHALDHAELTAVLSDATAPAEQRVAAAMVLTALDERRDESITRVRVAAESSASDPLRRALERVLDDGLDERAWRRLERASPRRA